MSILSNLFGGRGVVGDNTIDNILLPASYASGEKGQRTIGLDGYLKREKTKVEAFTNPADYIENRSNFAVEVANVASRMMTTFVGTVFQDAGAANKALTKKEQAELVQTIAEIMKTIVKETVDAVYPKNLFAESADLERDTFDGREKKLRQKAGISAPRITSEGI